MPPPNLPHGAAGLHVGRGKKNRLANHANILRELRENPELIGLVALNMFGGIVMLTRLIPDLPATSAAAPFEPRPWRDDDVTSLCAYLNTQGFKKAPIGIVHDIVMVEARARAFHPIREYLAGLTWDRTPRIGRFFLDYCGAATGPANPKTRDEIIEVAQATAYVEAVSRCFFVGAVARVMQPGVKLDNMLVLEGSQGALKSKLLRNLAVRAEWFSDSLPHSLESRDTRAHLSGKWLVEMSELSQFRGASVETLKSFLSCQEDKFRPAYGRSEVSAPRQCVFAGSTNSRTYLFDPTGNRRFWPLSLLDIKLAEIEPLVPQLWGEAYDAWRNGEAWWLTPQMEAIAAEQQAARLERDPWWEPVTEFVSLRQAGDWFTTGQIFASMGVETKDRRRGDEIRIASVLTELGCGHERRQDRRNRKWGWVKS